jgi:hypothetical protein
VALGGSDRTVDSDADDESFGVVVLGVGLAGVRVKEEPSAPHVRLAYIHLHASMNEISVLTRQSNSSDGRVKRKTTRIEKTCTVRGARCVLMPAEC